MRSPRGVLLSLGVAAALALPACGSDSAPTTENCTKVTGPEITITAKAMAFDASCLEVAPGAYQIVFVNDDDIAHNLHVRGKDLNEATDLKKKFTQTLDVTFTEPGKYPFVCDPHPAMKGVFLVSDPADPTAADS